MDIEPVRKILDSTAFIYNCFFTAVLILGVLTFLLWTKSDTIKAGNTYSDRDGNQHRAIQTMTRNGNGYWHGKDGGVITGE